VLEIHLVIFRPLSHSQCMRIYISSKCPVPVLPTLVTRVLVCDVQCLHTTQPHARDKPRTPTCEDSSFKTVSHSLARPRGSLLIAPCQSPCLPRDFDTYTGHARCHVCSSDILSPAVVEEFVKLVSFVHLVVVSSESSFFRLCVHATYT
jgi:hypothetical protein